MRPVPVLFHLGPLEIHTYGIGLAITFWVGYRYFGHRLRRAGYPSEWLATTFVWIVVAAVVGARALHVIANLSDYESNPLLVFAVWQGGLSSFGGLVLAVPVGLLSARRRCPQLRAREAAELVAPVLVACWALGRLLGPQLMIAGGGKPTHQWFGMYYADEIGRRLPVPIFQAIECTVIYLVTLALERWVRGRGGPRDLVTLVAVGLWCLARFFDEFLWLGADPGKLPIEILGLAAFGLCTLGGAWLLWRDRRRSAGDPAPAGAPRPPVSIGTGG